MRGCVLVCLCNTPPLPTHNHVTKRLRMLHHRPGASAMRERHPSAADVSEREDELDWLLFQVCAGALGPTERESVCVCECVCVCVCVCACVYLCFVSVFCVRVSCVCEHLCKRPPALHTLPLSLPLPAACSRPRLLRRSLRSDCALTASLYPRPSSNSSARDRL